MRPFIQVCVNMRKIVFLFAFTCKCYNDIKSGNKISDDGSHLHLRLFKYIRMFRSQKKNDADR